jgi:exosome complex component RRP42
VLYLDAVVISDAENLYDVLFIACRGALWDTLISRNRTVEYQATINTTNQTSKLTNRLEDEKMSDTWKVAVQTKEAARAADFELEDYGYPLSAGALFPVAVSLNVVSLVVNAHNIRLPCTDERLSPT